MCLIEIVDLKKVYTHKHNAVTAIDNLSLNISKSEFIVVKGASGCGKTTLLLTLAGMLRPTSGKVIITGENIYDLSGRARNNMRAKDIGYIFQMFHLIPYLNVFDNVMAGYTDRNKADKKLALELLQEMDLADRVYHKPFELSAGEQQRVALTRALCKKPAIILADEPTGNLDPENAALLIGYLKSFSKDGGTVVAVTHGTAVTNAADRILVMS